MAVQYLGLKEINGPLVALDNVTGVSYDEVAEITLSDGSTRTGRVVQIDGTRAILQVFEGTKGLSLTNTRTKFSGKPMEMPLSEELLGRVFNGAGRPIDGLGDIYAEKYEDINGRPLNPVARSYPRNYINTGISSIDALMTLIRGQKLPIFSGSGLSHNKLAVQIVRQAKIAEDSGQGFAVVFAAMGVKNDIADYFRRSFEESGVLQKVVMFLNLSNDPIIERILTPKCALTAAEYLAFEKNMHILVILTDMTSYAEALREFSSSKGEIPGRATGSLVAFESGEAVTYGLYNAQDRGVLFIDPGTQVYEGMVVGYSPKSEDIRVNVCKKKHVTNMRSSSSDEAMRLIPPRKFSLEEAIEFIADDEMLEITPKSIRIRKAILNGEQRLKAYSHLKKGE